MSVTSWIRRTILNGVAANDTLSGALLSTTTTTFSLTDGSTFPTGSVGPFVVTIGQGLATEEKVLCTSRSGAVVTIATNGRGYNNTTAQSHNATDSVLHTIDAQDLDEANQVAVQTLGAVAATGDLLVGSGANTLTKLARGTANQLLSVVGTTLQWIGFGVGQSSTSAVGDSAADGTQTTPARSDHKHAREAYVTNSLALGTAAAAGVATTLMRPDGTIAAFDTGQPTASAPGDTGGVGTAAFAARRDHSHGREAVPGAWTAYTPTWASTGTAPSIGNGTLLGAYKQVGKMVTFRIYILLGGTTTLGTGSYTFGLPATAVAGVKQVVACFLNDGSVHYVGVGEIASGGTIVTPLSTKGGSSGSLALISATQLPSGEVTLEGVYEAA